MICTIESALKNGCNDCKNFVVACNWDDCEEGYCNNPNIDDFEEDVYDRTY